MAGRKPESMLDYLGQVPPDTLYHYTSTDALMKIVESGAIWASDIQYLNDASEYEFIFSLIQARIAARMEQSPREGLQVLAQSLLECRHAMSRANFVACFSSKRDDLSQWRGYTPTNQGVCIGFSTAAIKKRIEFPVPPKPEDAERLMSEGLSLLVPVAYLNTMDGCGFDGIIDQACSPDNPDLFIKSSELATLTIAGLAPYYKHNSFEDEKEWRLHLGNALDPSKSPPIQFRQGKSMLIPYRQVDLRTTDASYITEVIIGPTPKCRAVGRIGSTSASQSRDRRSSRECFFYAIPPLVMGWFFYTGRCHS